MSVRTDPIARLKAQLSDQAREALDTCVRICAERGVALYLVGGAVRDLLLGVGHVDLDLAMETETAPVASAVAAQMRARAVTHERFGTATVKGDGFELDLARTRRERYSRPGALPDVEPASLSEDLARRDFTLNAIALRLTSPAGGLIDPCGGIADLELRHLRVLHSSSFRDDATRLLRAARYAARLGFGIEASTEEWLRRDLAYMDSISGARLRRELVFLLEEARAVNGALLARDLGLLGALHPCLQLRDDVAARWREALAREPHVSHAELGLCILIQPPSEAAVANLTARLHLTSYQQKSLLDLARLHSLSSVLAASHQDPAAVVALLEGHAPAAVKALGVREGGTVAEACEAYLAHWRHVRPHLRGDDLISLGVPQGPALGDILKSLRTSRLRGVVDTREDEVALVKRALGNQGG
jgi:tRNA nucleotidyltransferase (CCA-adding enzyme)